MHRTCDPASRSIPAGAARVVCLSLRCRSLLCMHVRTLSWLLCCNEFRLTKITDGLAGTYTETSGGRSSRIHLFGIWKFLVTNGSGQIHTLRSFKSPISVCSCMRLYPKLELPILRYEQNVNYTHLFPLLVSGPSQYHSLNHTSRKSKLYQSLLRRLGSKLTAVETKRMFKFRHQNAAQNHNPKTANTTFYIIAKVK
jgi:hypothetical protein